MRYARWDLAAVDLMAGPEPDATRLCALYPVDKRTNASGDRRPRRASAEPVAQPDLPPLLKGMLDAQEATGLPPAWLAFRGSNGDRR